MKQSQFVFITFLALGLVTLFIGVYPDTTTTTTTFKARSKNTTKTTKTVADPRCSHDGVRDILLSAATGRRKISRADFISLNNANLTVKRGTVETSIRSGKFDLGQGKYAELKCATWIEEVKDYIADGEQIPENLR